MREAEWVPPLYPDAPEADIISKCNAAKFSRMLESFSTRHSGESYIGQPRLQRDDASTLRCAQSFSDFMHRLRFGESRQTLRDLFRVSAEPVPLTPCTKGRDGSSSATMSELRSYDTRDFFVRESNAPTNVFVRCGKCGKLVARKGGISLRTSSAFKKNRSKVTNAG